MLLRDVALRQNYYREKGQKGPLGAFSRVGLTPKKLTKRFLLLYGNASFVILNFTLSQTVDQIIAPNALKEAHWSFSTT